MLRLTRGRPVHTDFYVLEAGLVVTKANACIIQAGLAGSRIRPVSRQSVPEEESP